MLRRLVLAYLLPDGTPHDHHTHYEQVCTHDRADAVARHRRKDVGPDTTSDHARYCQAQNQFAIDVSHSANAPSLTLPS